MIYSSQPARFLLMNLLMHAICYTHLTFIMLPYSLGYQNLSTEIKSPSFNYYCYFRVLSVWIQALLILIKLQIMSRTYLKLKDIILSTLTLIAFYLKLKNFAVLRVSLTQLLLGFQNQNLTTPYSIRRLKLMAIIFCVLTETDMEEG